MLNLRKKIVDCEDVLSTSFLPYNILPIPDDAPEEIPRITMTTKNGHSNLQLSLNSLIFRTNYDENFYNNWDACTGYLREKIEIINSILYDTLKQDQFLFTGLSTEMIFDNLNEDPIGLISKKLINIKSNVKPFDLNCKVTFVYKDCYYINITIMNARLYEGVLALGDTSLAKLKEKSHNIAIILDVNDRYSFNYKEGYTSDNSKMEIVFDIATDIINNKMENFIMEGVFHL